MDRELYKERINRMLDSLNDTELKMIANIVARFWMNSTFDKEASHE